jgi:hypothetical protein
MEDPIKNSASIQTLNFNTVKSKVDFMLNKRFLPVEPRGEVGNPF